MARSPEERKRLLEKANDVLERKERLLAEANAEEKIIREQLSKKYNLKTIASAKKRLKKLKQEHEELVEEGEEVMDELEKELEEIDE